MPGYGVPRSRKGLLSWAWAERRLTGSHNYWLVTVRPNGRPHAMPVWGVWVDGAFHFSSGRRSRKTRNLVRNPRCVVCTDRAHEAVIVEGVARTVKSQELLSRVARPYGVFFAKVPTGEPGSYVVDHTSAIYLIGPDGKYIEHLESNAGVDQIVTALMRSVVKVRGGS